MFFFFTIPWIFVIALVVIALGIGVSALQFILDHIIIITGEWTETEEDEAGRFTDQPDR